MRYYFLFFLLSILLISCEKNSKNIVDVSNVSVDFNVKRFDIDFYSTTEATLPKLKEQYRILFPHDNDSIWIRLNQVIKKIPAVNSENKNQLLKKSNFVQLKDSLGVYLMQINDVLLRNETAPLEYVKPTINQIVVNKRKLELIRKLEKDITKDAIKNKEFEIYN